jgi:uncharacterized protein YdeI (YjbR/CyaY-like superfamily)
MIETDRFTKVEVTSPAQLRRWLDAHHTQKESIWLVTYKKHVVDKYVSVDEILDQVLCFGWIDGLRRKLDDDRTMQLLSPRRHQVWAKSYKARAARLIAEGHMRPPGLAAIEASKRAGLWDATADVDALVIPPDLATALGANMSALENFERSAPSHRRNVLRWIVSARTAETRNKRIAKTVDLASRGARIQTVVRPGS